MNDKVYKDLKATLKVSSSNSNSISLSGALSTQDIQTGRLKFKLTDDEGNLQLETAEAYIYLASKTLKSEAAATIDKEYNEVTYILSDEEIKHAGNVDGELYLRYPNGQVLSAHKFKFKIERALIDQNVEIIESIYNVSFASIEEGYRDKFDKLGEELNRQLAKYKNLQTELISRAFEKLRKGEATKIVCYGDSLTYGYDEKSADIRPANPTPTPDGTVHIRKRAGVTYPEALETALKQIYPNVSVQNQGYSGDTVLTSYERWDGVNPYADITLLMLGHNDSKALKEKETITDFIVGYRKITERSIAQGSAVIFLTPPKQLNAADFTVDIYSQAIIQLAKEYQAPVVDMSQETAGISADFYSDTVHFNTKGYTFIGNKLASIFINKTILNMNRVQGHDSLNVTKETSGIQFNDKCKLSATENFPTEDSTSIGKGLALVMESGGKAYYAVYAEEPNLYFLPAVYAGSGTLNLKVEMNFSAEPASNTISYTHGTTSARLMNKPFKSTVYTAPDFNYLNSKALFIGGRINVSKPMYLPRRGYYTISIENLDTYAVNLFSLEFRSAEDVLFRNNELRTLGTYTGDISTLSSGTYELYSGSAVNMPFTGSALAVVEVYGGGSNRKFFKVTNLATKASYEGVYVSTPSPQIVWQEIATKEWVTAQIAASKNE